MRCFKGNIATHTLRRPVGLWVYHGYSSNSLRPRRVGSNGRDRLLIISPWHAAGGADRAGQVRSAFARGVCFNRYIASYALPRRCGRSCGNVQVRIVIK